MTRKIWPRFHDGYWVCYWGGHWPLQGSAYPLRDVSEDLNTGCRLLMRLRFDTRDLSELLLRQTMD